jgi:hypothetical protein
VSFFKILGYSYTKTEDFLYMSFISITKCGIALTLTLATLSLLGGCSLVSISPYDSNTDKAITKLHKNTAEFFAEAITTGEPGCEYQHHLSFYQKSKVSMSSLLVRAGAMADNRLTVEQLGLLSSSYSNLVQLHELGCFTPVQVDELWATFDVSFSAILRLELSKKYGR